MANIKVALDYTILDGQPLTFRSPADCSKVTGLVVYYPEGGTNKSKTFQFADAHGNNVGSIDLFAANVLVKVILDTKANRAYVQNADTNAYLEGELAKKYSPTNKPTAADVGLGNVPNVATNDQTPTFTAASTMATLTSGEKLSVAFGKIAKAITDLISHISNKSNPHGVTKAQVGLGNVPNVATNDQTPTYSAASTLATLASGEKLSVSMGKIMKAITDLISHIGNKSNPHGVTAAQAGAVPTSRTVNGKALSSDITLGASDVGAAPDGYGLGKTPPSVLANANAVTAAQFFRTTSSTSNLSAATHGVGISIPYSSSEGVQLMVRASNGAIRVRRTENGTTWYEEFVNPVMTAGTEYATVERSAGKTVYAKRIDYTFDSAIGNTDGLTDYTIDPGISGFKALVRCVCTDGSYILPYTSSGGGSITVKTVVGHEITLRAYKASLPARTLSFYLYYTKDE